MTSHPGILLLWRCGRGCSTYKTNVSLVLSEVLNTVEMAAREALKCVVFLGSVRENNMGSRAAKFIVRKLEQRGFQVTLLGQ